MRGLTVGCGSEFRRCGLDAHTVRGYESDADTKCADADQMQVIKLLSAQGFTLGLLCLNLGKAPAFLSVVKFTL